MNKSLIMLGLLISVAVTGCSRSGQDDKPEGAGDGGRTKVGVAPGDDATIRISEVPFSHDAVLKPGDALTFALPNGKTVAVWCKKYGGMMSAISDSDIGLGYGEKPFQELRRERIALPNGYETFGELLSYILSEGTIQSGDEFSYILYVK